MVTTTVLIDTTFLFDRNNKAFLGAEILKRGDEDVTFAFGFMRDVLRLGQKLQIQRGLLVVGSDAYRVAPKYKIDRIVESDAFLTTVTILWTVIALILMGYATRKAQRSCWMVGAGLLAVVILKLFFVDIGNLELLGRMVTFISVGVLMLVIGYFAPLPPRRAEEMEAQQS